MARACGSCGWGIIAARFGFFLSLVARDSMEDQSQFQGILEDWNSDSDPSLQNLFAVWQACCHMPNKGESCSPGQFVGDMYEGVVSLLKCGSFAEEGSSREVGRGAGIEGGMVGVRCAVSGERLRFEKGVKI